MKVGVPVEAHPEERRVALVPAVVPSLVKAKLDVLVEQGAGVRASFADSAYQEQGAQLVAKRAELFSSSDIVLRVRAWSAQRDAGWADMELLRSGQVVVGLLNPLGAPEVARTLAQRAVTAFAMELIPRISRAQSMDALSSQANIQGYKAVLMAAAASSKIFPMMMTAAGTILPVRAFVIGAGVAGLQAIATARRLGAVVQAYDVRPAVKDQVESLGARFLEISLDSQAAEGAGGYARAMDERFYQRQRELMAKVVADSDVVITTAAVPGSKAPVLITKDMVRRMRPQSVIVDLAADSGGNCELTRPGEAVLEDGVTVLGPVNLAATVPNDASQMFGRNVAAFLLHLVKDNALRVDEEDPIVRDTLLTHRGEVLNPRVRELLGMPGRLQEGSRGGGS